MRTDTLAHAFYPYVGQSWCRVCNCTEHEHQNLEFLDETELADYVAAQDYRKRITAAGFTLARELWAAGDDYATIAAEIVFRNL